MNTTSLKILGIAALVSTSLLPACKQKASGEAAEVRVVEVPVGCVAPAAAAPAPAADPALAAKYAVPTSKSEPAKSAPVKKADGSALKVKKLVVATDIERSKRQPSGEASSFKKGEFDKLYAFLEVENPGDEADVVVSFDPPSNKSETGNIELAVGRSPGWRTWGFSRAFDETGSWTAIVRTKDGKELARTEFEVL
jgi:hypothetical protein